MFGGYRPGFDPGRRSWPDRSWSSRP